MLRRQLSTIAAFPSSLCDSSARITAHHGGFHMDAWPWWPGLMHWTWPVIFGGAIALAIYFASRSR